MADELQKRIGRYMRDEVMAHSSHHRRRLAPAVGRRRLRPVVDVGQVPLTSLAEVEDPAGLVLRPEASRLARFGDIRLGGRIVWARLWGHHEDLVRDLMRHRYKPVLWVLDDGVPVGSSSADLERVATLGSLWLEIAGVGPADVLLGLLPPGPNLSYWEVVLGAREAGVSAIHTPPVPPAAELERLRPTVLAGRPLDLDRLLAAARAEGRSLARVHTLLVCGEPLDPGMRGRLAARLEAPGAAVVSAWAPPGVRALWVECREGSDLHTWRDAEVIHIVDPLSGTPAPPGADGEVVWTALGWRGTVFVRLRTGVFASLVDAPCPACGHPGPRLVVTSSVPAFLAALDRHAGVAGWQAELRNVAGREELVVFLTPADGARLEDLLRELDPELAATQYVVLDRASLDARLSAHADRRVVDLRAGVPG